MNPQTNIIHSLRPLEVQELKNRAHAKSPPRTRNFFQHLSNPFGTFPSIRQKRLLKAHTDTVRAKAKAKEKRLLNHFLQSQSSLVKKLDKKSEDTHSAQLKTVSVMKKKIALADCKYRSDRTQHWAGLPSKEYGRKTVQHPTQSPLTGFWKQMLQQLYVS